MNDSKNSEHKELAAAQRKKQCDEGERVEWKNIIVKKKKNTKVQRWDKIKDCFRK